MISFSKQFTEARKTHKMTQAEVAEKLNVTFQTVSLWERGETSPDIDKLPGIAALFHVTTDWLLTGKTEMPVIDFEEPLSDRLFNEERMYTYVKAYAAFKNLPQTSRVLPYARELHAGQVRRGKDSVPYIYHPLLIACHALALGLDEDNLISTALLHDVCEDCGVPVEELPVNEETKEAVSLMTKPKYKGPKSDQYYETYYAGIEKNPIASLVKLLDRCNNISSMATGFSRERMVGYIKETERWIYPLLHHTKHSFPQYSNQIFLIKYHMTSLVETLKRQLST